MQTIWIRKVSSRFNQVYQTLSEFVMFFQNETEQISGQIRLISSVWRTIVTFGTHCFVCTLSVVVKKVSFKAKSYFLKATVWVIQKTQIKPLTRQIYRRLVIYCLLQFSEYFNIVQSWWKCCLSVQQLGSGWDAELLGVSFGSKLFAHVTLVVFCELRVKTQPPTTSCQKKIVNVKGVPKTIALNFDIVYIKIYKNVS